MAEIQAIQEKALFRALGAIHRSHALISNDFENQQRLKTLMEKMEDISKINEGIFNRESYLLSGLTLLTFITGTHSANFPEGDVNRNWFKQISKVSEAGGKICSTWSDGSKGSKNTERGIVDNIYQSTAGTGQHMQGIGRELSQASQGLVQLLQKGG